MAVDIRSTAERLRDGGQLAAYWASLSEDEKLAVEFDWNFWARQDQKLPPGDWRVWLLMGGRGFGKTRVLAETLRKWKNNFRYTSVIGATADDVNNTLVDGESGIIACCAPDERPEWVKSHRKLTWPNGAQTLLFSADSPERLRGKQHEKIIADEIAAWGVSGAGGATAATTRSDAEATKYAYDMAKLGLRLGPQPQMAIATTPRPIPLLQTLMDDPKTVTTTGSTMSNASNLNEDFVEDVLGTYSGTRLGRQEVYGELLMDYVGSLFPGAVMDGAQAGPEVPTDLDRIVVAVDPSGAVDGKKHHDDIGIVVVGMKVIQRTKYYWALADRTVNGGPKVWGTAAVKAYEDFGADRIVAETNYGGGMVEAVIRQIDPTVSYKTVTATRGKVQRAEPIAALFEQSRVFLHGSPAKWHPLRKQLEAFTVTGYQGAGSPDRADALVWGISEMMTGVVPRRVLDFDAQKKSYWRP